MINNSDFRILVVEDEIILAHTMKEMLHEIGYNRISMAHNNSLAETIIEEAKIDLAILDINLGKGEEGIRLAKKCQEKLLPFFYVTSYTDKSTLDKALATAPGAYLIKPYLQSNLYTALQITLNSTSKKEVQFISVKEGTDLIKINIDEIIYLLSENIYLKIITAKKNYLIRSSLKPILDQLPENKFVQTHRAYAVNKSYFTKLKSESLELGEHEIPISRSFKNQVRDFLEVS